MKLIRRLAPALLAALVSVPALAQRPAVAPAVAPRIDVGLPILKSPTIQRVRGAQQTLLLNKQAVVEGYYANDSIPMVVDDLDRLRLDMVLPEEAYVPIAGKVPATLRRGDRVRVTGTLVSGSAASGRLAREATALRLDNTSQLQVLTPAAARRVVTIPGISVGVIDFPSKYAVLIAGGANAASNYTRYWNDLSAMYGLLRNKGYPADNIYVLYADGAAKDATMPVDYSATKANIATVFSTLATKMSGNDTLYIMLNDHGGGFMNPGVGGYGTGNYGGVLDESAEEKDPGTSEAAVNQYLNGDGDKTDVVNFDETLSLWYESMTDDEFAAQVNKVQAYGKMIIQMKQCFSGGFVHDLLGPRRIVMASAAANQPSWSEDAGNFGEFTYWYISALRGSKVDGSGPVNADANGDGKVSILEAYNFARANDSRPETPQFDDSGTLPVRTGAMPVGDDGALAGATFL